MASYLSGLAGNFSSYITPRKPALGQRLPAPPLGDEIYNEKSHDAAHYLAEGWLSSTKTIDLDELDQSTPLLGKVESRKRPRVISAQKTTKRRKKDDDAYNPNGDDFDDDLEGPTLMESAAQPIRVQSSAPLEKPAIDRKRMPPPPAPEKIGGALYQPDPKLVDRNLERQHRIVRMDAEEADLSDDEVFSQRNRVAKTDRREVAYDFDHERARRHADAVELPHDVGYWSNADKDLFFRLSMRGFEPLVPANWNIDFKTLPVSLFAVEDGDDPVIEPYDTRQFRAIHYLELLFSTGMRVRDRRIMFLRSEPIICSVLRQYISWALYDAGVHQSQRPRAIPIHAVKTLRRGEKTHEALTRMTRRLHQLAARFHDLHGIFPSVEQSSTGTDNTVPEVGEDDDIRFPVLTGFLVCSSVVLVVTLETNPAHFKPLPPLTPVETNKLSKTAHKHEHISKDESGLRFIATFDFSDYGMDVWNGLAIALVVMRIRKTMRQMMVKAGDGAEMWKASEESPGKDDNKDDL